MRPLAPFTALLFLSAPAVAYLDCRDCGGNIFKNNIEIWSGYLLQVAGQLDINVLGACRNGSDIYRTITEAGGGMCVNFPGNISLPAPAYACYDASTVKPSVSLSPSVATSASKSTTFKSASKSTSKASSKTSSKASSKASEACEHGVSSTKTR